MTQHDPTWQCIGAAMNPSKLKSWSLLPNITTDVGSIWFYHNYITAAMYLTLISCISNTYQALDQLFGQRGGPTAHMFSGNIHGMFWMSPWNVITRPSHDFYVIKKFFNTLGCPCAQLKLQRQNQKNIKTINSNDDWIAAFFFSLYQALFSRRRCQVFWRSPTSRPAANVECIKALLIFTGFLFEKCLKTGNPTKSHIIFHHFLFSTSYLGYISHKMMTIYFLEWIVQQSLRKFNFWSDVDH